MKLRLISYFAARLALWLVVLNLSRSQSFAVGLKTDSGDHQELPNAALNDCPLMFESNLGQYADPGRFIARGAAYYLAIAPTELRIVLQKQIRPEGPAQIAPGSVGKLLPVQTEYRVLRIGLVGANESAQIVGDEVRPVTANYFLGNDPSQWRTGVPAYRRVRVTDVYPGINLLHYGSQQSLEYDFEIAPGADADLIQLRFDGVDKLRIDTVTGELILTLGEHEVRQPKPTIYQAIRGERKVIRGGYTLSSPTTVKFAVGEYDQALPLVIDPVVSYSKIFGGPDHDVFWAIALDGNGNTYLAGETLTPGLATAGAFQTNLAGTLAGHGDVIVAKFNNQLTATNYVTYLGGSAYDAAFALAVDGAGNAYVTGYTGSTNFPTRFPVQTNIAGKVTPGFTTPPLDLFVAKLGASGSNLVFSTFYGGSAVDVGVGIALDASTNVYVVGQTSSTNFPTKNTASTNLASAEDGFVLKLDAAGTNVIYAMYLGGSGSDFARDVQVGPAGNPVVVGYTSSTNFPVTTNALQRFLNQTTNVSYADDAFLCEIAANAGVLNYATFLGGTNSDQAFRLAFDTNGAVYIAGWTQSGDFPRTSTNFYTTVVSNATYADVFVTKLNPTLTNLDYSVTFGGSAKDWAWDVAVDGLGRASVIGETASLDFPTNSLAGILEGSNSGGTDAFVAQINAAGTGFIYSAYLGSPAEDVGYGVAVDSSGNAYFIGCTASAEFPIYRGNTFGAFSDQAGFIVKMLADELPVLNISLTGTKANLTWSGLFPELTVQSTTNLLATNSWVNVNAAPVVTNSQSTVTLTITNPPQFFRLKR